MNHKKLIDGPWEELSSTVTGLELADISKLIKLEVEGRRREYVLSRLYGTYTKKLRSEDIERMTEGKLPRCLS